MAQVDFRSATAADWPAIAALLTQASLPLAGAEAHLPQFTLALRDGQVAAVAGLEVYGTSALLRSVAVSESDRGTGLGQEIVRRLLDSAATTGVATVVLLTTTAAGFFPRFGFVPVTRDEVPQVLLTSQEFQTACPASATVMRLDLLPSQIA